MAADIYYNSWTDTLSIRGTSARDIAFVQNSGSSVKVTAQDASSKEVQYFRDPIKKVYFYGNDGNDYFSNQTSIPTYAYGHGGDDILIGGSGADYLHGYDGNDSLHGQSGNDYINAGDGNDYVNGSYGNDRLYGYSGSDRIYGSYGDDQIYGGYDNDTIDGGWGEDEIFGSYGNDLISGGGSDDEISGDYGDDRLYGNSGNDLIRGGSGNDSLFGGDGNDRLGGSYGNDSIRGEDGNDQIWGDSGDDWLWGGDDDDNIDGGWGTDVVYGDYGDDTVYGGQGNDYIWGGYGNDSLNGNEGNDQVNGDSGNDVVRGESGNDRLYGSWGDDDLYGGSGTDTMLGGNGDDGLFGGVGSRDYLHGGSGDDRFLAYQTWWGTNEETVADQGTSDAVIFFKNGQSGEQEFRGIRDRYYFTAGSWNDSDIESVDVSLKQLHETTQNTRLLEESDGTSLTFNRIGDQYRLVRGTWGDYWSRVTSGTGILGWNNDFGEITLTNYGFSNDVTLHSTVVHEIGHNWDDTSEMTDTGIRSISNLVNDFRNISNWSTSWNWGATRQSDGGNDWFYNRNASFARDYGRTNPWEDMATVWEAYFVHEDNHRSIGVSTNGIAGKLQVLDRLFAALS